MQITHIYVEGRSGTRMVEDDVDRYRLLKTIRKTFPGTVLAYRITDTRLDLVVEAPAVPTRNELDRALRGYARGFNARHGSLQSLYRGPIVAIEMSPTPEELAWTIRFVHENPNKSRPPLSDRAIEFRWSGARALGGLALDSTMNVERATSLIGDAWRHAIPTIPPLADAERRTVPRATPELIRAGAADVYRVPVWEIAEGRRKPPIGEARALFARLAHLEGYEIPQFVPLLNCEEQHAYWLLARPVPDRAVQIARTLLRDECFRTTFDKMTKPHEGKKIPICALSAC